MILLCAGQAAAYHEFNRRIHVYRSYSFSWMSRRPNPQKLVNKSLPHIIHSRKIYFDFLESLIEPIKQTASLTSRNKC